jgi:hypothetical protein
MDSFMETRHAMMETEEDARAIVWKPINTTLVKEETLLILPIVSAFHKPK